MFAVCGLMTLRAQVMLCFSRDCEVLAHLKGSVGNALTVTIKGKQTCADSVTVFPPSGIIPFHGFTMYGKDTEMGIIWVSSSRE